MRRFRILFVAVTVVVVVPVGLLVRRALQSVEVERRTRHEAVAERIFDEMERALSGLLAREEERPFGQYSFEYVPPGQDATALLRSPIRRVRRSSSVISKSIRTAACRPPSAPRRSATGSRHRRCRQPSANWRVQ